MPRLKQKEPDSVAMFRDSNNNLIKYTSVGGYPVIYYSDDGDIFCPDCANRKNGSECRTIQTDNQGYNDGWLVIAGDVFYEGREYCCHCGVQLESAYGEV
jgi:hypothetical protein